MEGGGGVPHNEVDGDEEAAQDDAEGAGDDGEDDVLLQQDRVPGRPPAAVAQVTAGQTYNKYYLIHWNYLSLTLMRIFVCEITEIFFTT